MMKTTIKWMSLMLIAVVTMGSIVACGDDDEDQDKSALSGQWVISSDKWKGLVTISGNSFQSEDYSDEDGYGIYRYKGLFTQGSVNNYSSSVSFYSSANYNDWKDCGLVGHTFDNVDKIENEMTIGDSYGSIFTFSRNSQLKRLDSDIYGLWEPATVSGASYRLDRTTFIEAFDESKVRMPVLAFSETPLKGQSSMNAYYYRVSSSNKDIKLGRFSINGNMLTMDSDDAWFAKTWTLVSVDANELKFAVEGEDGYDYIKCTVTYKRVKAIQ